jgi:hypothetical protein
LIEINGTSNNAAVDKQTTGLMAVCTYTMGLYHRKPEEDPNAGKVALIISFSNPHFRNNRHV